MTMTVNQPAVIDDAEFTVRRTIRIAAPIDRVWSAVTEPAHISRWFGRTEFHPVGATADGSATGATAAPGTLGTMTFEGHGAIPLRVEEIDAPRMVSYRWSNDDALESRPEALDESTSTVFTFTLEPAGDGTQLTVVETGFDRTSDAAANLADHGEGWTSELDKLVALLEADA